VKSAIRNGIDSMHLLREHLAIGTCCGKCKSCTKKILRECQSQEENLHAQLHTLHFQALAA
jgi:bacterioferritin-associated ferredoxin